MPADASGPPPLWERRAAPAPPEQAITSVHRFLTRCRAWGTDLELPRRLERFRESPSPDAAAALHQWTSFVAFLDHALAELEGGELDSWFEAEQE